MSTLNVDTLVGVTSANAITVRGEGTATTSLQQGLCKCWTNFTGITNTTERDSFNVDSMTDVDTGRTTMNLTNNMANANYTGFWYTNGSTATGYLNFNNAFGGGLGSFATSSFSTSVYIGTSAYGDAHRNFAGIFGDLA